MKSLRRKTTEKKGRNDEIKRLWKSGITQKNIADRYHLNQSRVSAIIHGKLPSIRYCRGCGVHSEGGRICSPCHAKAKKRLQERHENIRARQAKEEKERVEKLKRNLSAKQRYCKNCNSLVTTRYKRLCNECFDKRKVSSIRRECFKCGAITQNSHKICYNCAPYAKDVYRKKTKGRGIVRGMVRARDNYTCQTCKVVRTADEVAAFNHKIKTLKGKMRSLDVHHLGGMCGKNSRGYDKMENMDTLITLCHKCHFNHPEHSKKGRTNKN